MAEHLIRNEKVGGSTPPISSKTPDFGSEFSYVNENLHSNLVEKFRNLDIIWPSTYRDVDADPRLFS